MNKQILIKENETKKVTDEEKDEKVRQHAGKAVMLLGTEDSKYGKKIAFELAHPDLKEVVKLMDWQETHYEYVSWDKSDRGRGYWRADLGSLKAMIRHYLNSDLAVFAKTNLENKIENIV